MLNDVTIRLRRRLDLQDYMMRDKNVLVARLIYLSRRNSQSHIYMPIGVSRTANLRDSTG